jgi:hypothetical protein
VARCNEQAQICVNDYAHVTGLGIDSCQPLPGSVRDSSDVRVRARCISMRITTTCDDGTLPLQVFCQPD